MLQVSELFVYPIKSLGGIGLRSARVTDRGLEHDRRWMLVDSNNRFLSQREFSQMALLRTAITTEGIAVRHINYPEEGIVIPFIPQIDEAGEFTVWDDTVRGRYVSHEADVWFSDMLGTICRLVYMPDETMRETGRQEPSATNITSLSDAYPFLLLGEATLGHLNEQLDTAVPVNRFRANIIFSGGQPHDEDTMAHIKIGDIDFYGVKLCARCNVITIDQDTTHQSKEPTRTLARYRALNNKIYFGQNLLHTGEGSISVGDKITIVALKEALIH
ncbi:MOSC domain-containing protein [Mucilaginibacter sp. HMF5004]|uniref:MOSC domain-containing protein n=1 Tax=Mucilaginibacter rivuli TaxID=2857527 RepID=UPI001C5E7F16|nr:MOSC N-terminal beta barrel domain-containing protein [Mucilaginibacter rivuli]MBW4889313.1 MOSC domain-containing protein [Mucilaginibacter rivuli]